MELNGRAGRQVRRCLPLVALTALAALGAAGCTSSAAGQPVAASAIPGGAARPIDACGMLTSDQVAGIVGTPGPYTGAHEDAAPDGSPTWGCTWGTPDSYADIREVTSSSFAKLGSYSDVELTPLNGIGDKAVLEKRKSDGSNPYVYFLAATRYYEVEIVVDRRETGTTNAPREANAAQVLAKMLAKLLAG